VKSTSITIFIHSTIKVITKIDKLFITINHWNQAFNEGKIVNAGTNNFYVCQSYPSSEIKRLVCPALPFWKGHICNIFIPWILRQIWQIQYLEVWSKWCTVCTPFPGNSILTILGLSTTTIGSGQTTCRSCKVSSLLFVGDFSRSCSNAF